MCSSKSVGLAPAPTFVCTPVRNLGSPFLELSPTPPNPGAAQLDQLCPSVVWRQKQKFIRSLSRASLSPLPPNKFNQLHIERPGPALHNLLSCLVAVGRYPVLFSRAVSTSASPWRRVSSARPPGKVCSNHEGLLSRR